MTELYKLLLDYKIWPVLLTAICYFLKDQASRTKSIESKFNKIEKELVRISTLVESYISDKIRQKPG
ncbi:MAG TPA: hypothetical protein PK816_10100 [Candidatus Cloacimonadota bacterium]|nr:hypothetical protein [Candidatus Cloacimonadota bacterium]